MEVDGNPNSNNEGDGDVMALGSVQGSVRVELHPLVVLNISEHWTRVKAQTGAPRRVVGALVGKQEGRKVELHNSFEVVVNGDQLLDLDFFREKEDQFKQVFVNLGLVGWYATGPPPDQCDMTLHAQFCELTESPLFLKLNPVGSRGERLPLDVFESLFEVHSGRTRTLLVPLQFSMVAEEAETIGVNHVAKASQEPVVVAAGGVEDSASSSKSSSAAASSSTAATLTSQHHAVAMLRTRVGLLLAYVRAVQSGVLPADQALLRDIQGVCRRLPAAQGAQFAEEFYKQCNDVTLTALLGSVTQGCAALNQFIAKFGVIHDKKGAPHQRTRGVLYPS